MKFRSSRLMKILSVYVLVNFLFMLVSPTFVFALTSGPNSPEFSNFTPVGSNEMVNLFSGEFCYNIPVVEVPGPHDSSYAVSLSYNSGSSSETESSWVGFGWTLNPGAINRELRGFPDEYAGQKIDYYNKTRPNWTLSSSRIKRLEISSKDIETGEATRLGGASLSFNNRLNNFTGYQKITSIGVDYKGMAGVDASIDANGVTFSPFVSPLAFLANKIKVKADGTSLVRNYLGNISKKNPSVRFGNLNVSMYGVSMMAPSPPPYNFPEYDGFSVNWSASLQINGLPYNLGFETGSGGSFNLRYGKYKTQNNVYGYLNTLKAEETSMVDYYVEKDGPMKRTDLFIGVPFNNQDYFNVTGEGVAGGFRAYNTVSNDVRPKASKSGTTTTQAGFEVMVGAGVGIGLDLGLGKQTTSVTDWNGGINTSGLPQSSVFRFNNDMGGHVSYGDTEIARAGIFMTSIVPGFKSASITSGGSDNMDGGNGSSFIVAKKDSENLFSGFSIFNKDGKNFYYGEPVYIRNETSLSVDVVEGQDINKGKYLVFKDLLLSSQGGNYTITDLDLKKPHHRSIIGEINNNKYANTYLLTEIRSPEYVDADAIAGPSDNDFGGWTKFSYRKTLGEGKGSWYRYRMPYNGLFYQQNSISDIKDDMGSISTGEKEVKYLHTIETKTHIAYFISNKTETPGSPMLTGSGTQRKDGIGAKDLTSINDPSSVLPGKGNAFGNTELEYLEKVVLFAKNSEGTVSGQKPLKVVHFQYDYTVVPNVANNINSNFNYQDDGGALNSASGKLTLKKVWTEYEGIVSAKISPYVFNYFYPEADQGNMLSKYFTDEGYDKILPGYVQNPSYKPFALDPWGNITPNGEERRKDGISWIDQSAYFEGRTYGIDRDGNYFDPAAYQLKSIRLPSGGTIFIQYEAKDYAHVQNRDAMAMARISLKEGVSGPSYKQDDYIVDVKDLGCDPSSLAMVSQLVDKINTHFQPDTVIDGAATYSKKIYYKFLFSLLDGNPSIDNHLSEYITGYAHFNGAGIIELPDGNYGIKVSMGSTDSSGGDRSMVPRQACYEFVANQRQGKVTSSSCIEPKIERQYDNNLADRVDDGTAKSISTYALAGKMMDDMASSDMFFTYTNLKKDQVGKHINPKLSFLKLPIAYSKVGGGVRVKRLLLYDQGIESGDEVVMGTNYRYEMEDGTSSGVATNEPVSAREENPLVDFIPVKGQKWWDKLIAGEMLEQTEGPLGESILPAPFVGHRRVVVENIHTGSSGNGYAVNEFYTTYDYPFDKKYRNDNQQERFDFIGGGSEKTGLKEKSDNLGINTGLFNFNVSKSWAIQGFRFIQNNMNGQSRKVSTYSGSYSPGVESPIVSYQEYMYYEPGEYVKLMSMDQNQNLQISQFLPGKDMDVVRGSKKINDVNLDFNVEFDIGIAFKMPIPIFAGIWPSFSYRENVLATHATTKIISYPAIVKSVTSMADGITSKSENIAFNSQTGDPVVVKSWDSFEGIGTDGGVSHEGSVYQFSVPASWIYQLMGSKSVNENYTNQLTAMAANFSTYETEPDAAWLANPVHLLQATIQTYKNNWGEEMLKSPKVRISYPELANQRDVLDKVWRPMASYTYKADALSNAGRVYDRGYFDIGSDRKFLWNSLFQEAPWIRSSETTLYSPDGESLEEKDVLNIPSAAIYGSQYRGNVPVMVAGNADNNSILFNDFEKATAIAAPMPAHSGKGAAMLSELSNLIDGVYCSPSLKEQGGLFRVWVHFSDDIERELQLKLSLGASGGDPYLTMKKIARTENWFLYEAELTPDLFAEEEDNSPLSCSIITLDENGIDGVYIDDLRFQPMKASSNCFVYDVNDLRLLAQFDDQHFGTYYQYNQEGKLVRKILETERGRYTLQEMNYNTYKEARNN